MIKIGRFNVDETKYKWAGIPDFDKCGGIMSKYKWISIEDKYPEFDEPVLLAGRVYGGARSKLVIYIGEMGSIRKNGPSFLPVENVEYWMPLPEPPGSIKTVENDKEF